jgi:hypothetical protein
VVIAISHLKYFSKSKLQIRVICRSFSETDLDYTNNTYEISARWIDFRDNESNIAHYFWCIGSEPLHDDIMLCENATSHLNRTLKGLSLQHNDKYYVTVLACNYTGLCTGNDARKHSIDEKIINTCAVCNNY